ncbi:MAG: HEAT repeat domain-containing protein [Planctomycetes bacterium]|nr:HEAT repeat domain-containing protein [Planctomycetota bacterium]
MSHRKLAFIVAILILWALCVSLSSDSNKEIGDLLETTDKREGTQSETNERQNSGSIQLSENETTDARTAETVNAHIDASKVEPIATNARWEYLEERAIDMIFIEQGQYELCRMKFNQYYDNDLNQVMDPDRQIDNLDLTEWVIKCVLRGGFDSFKVQSGVIQDVIVQTTIMSFKKNFDYSTYSGLLELVGKAYQGEYLTEDDDFRISLETLLTEDEADEYQMLLYENKIGMPAEYWLGKLIEGEKNNDLRLLREGYWGLTRVRKEDCLAILHRAISLFQSENMRARWHSAMIPAIIGPGAEEAIPGLRNLLTDEHHIVRREAAISLGKIGSSSWVAIDDLANLLDQRDVTGGMVHREAILALANIGEPSFERFDKIVAIIEGNEFINTWSNSAAIMFVTMYAQHAPPETEMKLIEVIENPKYRVAEERKLSALAAVALTKFHHLGENALVPLTSLLESEAAEYNGYLYYDHKAAAAYALSKMGELAEPAIDALISEIFNLNVAEIYIDYIDAYTPVGKWFTVSELCAEALGNIGDAAMRAVPELERLASIDGSRYGLSEAQEARVQAAAREAIRKIE